MSEADAGEVKEELPSWDVEEPVEAMLNRDDRRSPSVELVGGDIITLHSVFYQGKALKLAGTHNHIYNVVFRILKNVCKQVKQLTVAFPPGWDEDKPDSAKIAELCKIYNRVAKPFANAWSGSYNTETLKDWGERYCTQRVATEITTYAYELAVPRPADLNHYYKSFTSETYGETNLDQMASIIEELNIGPNDVFLDLGSGIGQLVCFASSFARCKRSIGIELSQIPANYAEALGDYFKKLMNHFGKTQGRFELFQGDFLDPKFKKMITEEATIIFINNFAFSPELMHRITTELLQDLKHGTRIVTTKPFGDHKKDITVRRVGNINAISHTVELKSLESGVSWTAKQVKFWLTTMDHTKLIKYYEEEHKKRLEPKSSREGSEVNDTEKGHRKQRKKNRESSGHREKVKTEQAAASQHSPKWNEPDTDYSPPVKKPKKEKKEHRDMSEPSTSEKHYTSKDPERKKKKKDLSTPKPAKTPKASSSRHSDHPTSNRSSSTSSAVHSSPSLPKATAPPPSVQQQQQSVAKPMRPSSAAGSSVEEDQFEAKKALVIRLISELNNPDLVSAVQDAISSAINKGTDPVQHGQMNTPAQYNSPPSITAPVNVYPPVAMAPQQPPQPPQPPQPAQQPPLMQHCSEFVGEQRHTFMIPPTDPLYGMVVSYYFEIKKYVNLAKVSDLEIVGQLRADIESEKVRRNDLIESANSTELQISELLNSGVHTLKSHLTELGMHGVSDVTELLTGSKDIVTKHKGLTNTVYTIEQEVSVEEQRLVTSGSPDALRRFNDAVSSNLPIDNHKLADEIIKNRPLNFVILPENIPTIDSKVSPSSRRARQPKPKQANGSKRGSSTGRRSDAPEEDVEIEIQQFVQHAMKVDNAVKEKERKERHHRPPRSSIPTPSKRDQVAI